MKQKKVIKIDGLTSKERYLKAVEMKKVRHYNQGNIEAIDFINKHNTNFNIGNVIKYIARCQYKGNKEQDIRKAITYLDYEIEYNNNPLSWVVEGMKVEDVVKDWQLEGNLYHAMVSIYTYIISGNKMTLIAAKKQLQRELI